MSFRNIIEANDIKVNNITDANKIKVNSIEATDISAMDTSTKTLTMNGALYANNTKGENGQVLASTGDGIQWTNTTGHGPWNTDSQNDLYYNGKVGIGTNNPTKTLDVNGDVRTKTLDVNGDVHISGAIHASNGSGSDKQVLSSTGNGLKWVNEDGVGPWDTTGDNVFYDKSNGKVGIGTDDPTEKLHVNGDIKIDGGINMSGKLCLEGGTGANGQFLMSQGPNALPVWANIDSSNNGTPSIIRTSTWTDISTNNYIYYVDKNGENNIGKVGIGIETPGYTLDVNGDVHISGALHDANDSSGNYGQVLSSTGNGLEWINEDGVGPWDTSGSHVYYDKNNGNVGIGTNNPTKTLHVEGDIYITGAIHDKNNISGTSGQVLSSTGVGLEWVNEDGVGPWDTSGNHVYYNKSNGNVGIGIDNPTKTLDVSGNVRIYGALHDKTDSSGTSGQVLSSTGDGLEWVNEDGVGPWNTSGNHVYYNKSNGNVGIGIDNPTKTLDVSGNVRIYGALHDKTDSSGNNGQVLSSTGDGLAWVDTTSHGPWDTSGNHVYYNTGNVGIGSNIPQAKLDVAGDSLINGVTVGRGPGGPTDLLNTVLGKGAFKKNTTGEYNAAIGYLAMEQNTTGMYNVACGAQSLTGNKTGQRNIAVGYSALNLSDVTSDNIAVGYNALHYLSLSSSTNNVAVGNDALKYNNGGEKNVAIGNEVLKNTTFNNVFGNTSGSCNTAVGYGAGINNQHGRRNTFIGCGAKNANANSNKVNQIVIGCDAVGNNDNEITLGDTQIQTLRCMASTISSLSDARDKKNIIDIPYGLDLINNLQPRQFTWDIRGETENNPHQGTSRVGFIAQEVQSVLGEDNSVLNMIHSSNPEKLELSYTQLIPVLTKAVQELSSQLTAEKEKTAILESKLTTIEARLAALEAK